MNPSEKDAVLRGWEKISSLAIVKDVATKGKYIELSITCLAKRMGDSVDEARKYFRTEIDVYVRSLLANGQVFRAEHVLKNLNRSSKYVFYEYMMVGMDDGPNSSNAKGHQAAKNNSSVDSILKYLNKIDNQFEAQRADWDMVLRMLKTISTDRTVRDKFAGRLEWFTLEEVFERDETFRHEIAAEVFFVTQNTYVVPALRKELVWSYLLERKQFGLVIKWINILGTGEDSTDDDDDGNRSNQFENDLRVMFRHWSISEEMLDEVGKSEVNESVRDSLARHGMFLRDERDQMPKVLERIFKTESWQKNVHLVNDSLMRKCIVEQVMEFDLRLLMIQEVCSTNHLSELLDKYPKFNNYIALCLALRSAESPHSYDVSKKVSSYILDQDENFYNHKPLVYLAEEMLKNFSNPPPLSTYQHDVILARIPFVHTLLTKISQPTIHDHQTTLADMVKRFLKIDLKQIQQEAGNEPLCCSNTSLISKFGTPEKLEFLYYIKQCRSSFAVFVFAVEQLRLFAKVSTGQIMYACSQVTNLALAQLDHIELVAHCMAFVEMLGIDSSAIRAHIRCVRLARAAKPNVKLDELTEKEFRQEVLEVVAQKHFNTDDIEALRVVCEASGSQLPVSLLTIAFGMTDWFRGLAFASYFGYSAENIVEVLSGSERARVGVGVDANLVTALRYECAADRPRRSSNPSHRRRPVKTGELNMVSSRDTMSSSISSVEQPSPLVPSAFLDQRTDLFAVILQCTSSTVIAASTASSTSSEEDKLDFAKLLELLLATNHSTTATSGTTATTASNLFRRSIQMKWPILAVIAATLNIELRNFSWFTWLTLSTNWQPTTGKQFCESALELIENAVSTEHVTTLHHSFQTFYPDHCFRAFTEFLHRTTTLDFSDRVTQLLRLFLEAVNHSDEEHLHLEWLPAPRMLKFAANLLILHLKHNIETAEHQQLLLDSVCCSDIEDFCSLMDFCTVRRVNEIVSSAGIMLNIDRFRRDRYNDTQIRTEYERICEQLVNEQHFAQAAQLADCLSLPKDNIIYDSWVWQWQTNATTFDLTQCERDMIACSLAPEMVISFYTLVADKLAYEDVQKYVVLKRVLDVVKRHNLFPNESFNCDRVELEMVLSYLRNAQTIDELDVYYSEYFESIMAKERFVLYKSFSELKEISGREDLMVCYKKALSEAETKKLDDLIFKLLDVGDIVQALRLQAIFEYCPVDLHYLVFSMAIAENLKSLSDLTPEQEQLNREASKFIYPRRTLRPSRSQSSAASSPVIKPDFQRISSSFVALEFEEIPSREKQDILSALQSFAARIEHGARLAQRIVMTWRAAMHLDQEYVDVLKTKDAYMLLESATRDDCIYKLDVMNDIMCSMELTKQESAEFLADKIAFAVVQSNFYIIPTANNPTHNVSHPLERHTLWGYDLDKEFRLFLELCPSTAALGNRLLQHCDALKLYRKFDPDHSDTPHVNNECAAVQEIFERLKQLLDNRILSHKKQNTICVELLIKAHDCFVHECYMEGIAWVLHRTKMLNVVLSNAKSWSLIVRMLMGIGRYREMYYCFETLIKNNRFESLLGKFDADRVGGLNQAIISYLREHCQENSEYYRLTALHFRMYKEIAQMWESEAKAVVTAVLAKSQFAVDEHGVVVPTFKFAQIDETTDQTVAFSLRCSPEVVQQLNTAMDGYAHAAENYLIDNKLALAQTTASLAELMALQIHLVRKGFESKPVATLPEQQTDQSHCVCVVNIVSATMMKYIVNNYLSVSHSLIVGRAYPFEINWTDALYSHYVNGNSVAYLNEFCDRLELTDSMIEAVVKMFQNQPRVTATAEANVARLVEMVDSVTLRYKLASFLGLKGCIAALINGHSLFYLKDTNYGRNEGVDK